MLFECRIYSPDMQLKQVVTREAIHEKFQEEYRKVLDQKGRIAPGQMNLLRDRLTLQNYREGDDADLI